MKKKMVLLFVILVVGSSCNDETEQDFELNAQRVVSLDINCAPIDVNRELYLQTTSGALDIEDVEILNDCLIIDFWATGCSGEFWELGLIDSQGIKESDPPQRDLKLWLANDEPCEGEFLGEVSFEVSNLQIVNSNSLILNINDSIKIVYNY